MRKQQHIHKNVWLFRIISYFLLILLFPLHPPIQAAPGDILYENAFANNSDVYGDWSRLSGGSGDFRDSANTFNSSPRSLRIRDGSGGTSNNNLIDASLAASAEVSFWLRQGSPADAPESGEDLELYYINSSNNWVLLTTYLGSDAAGTVYNETITLPADALHNNLRFRFDMIGGADNDRWYVDDFVVTETGTPTPATLELHYEFDEGTGQTIADASGNNRTGTLGDSSSIETDDPGWQCEQNSGWAMDFDSSQTQHISTAAFTPPPETTIAFWMRRQSAPTSTERIFGFSSSWEIRHLSGGQMYLDINATDGPITAAAYNSIGSWTHFAATFSVSTGAWQLYINGSFIEGGTYSQSAQPSGSFRIGGSAWQSSSQHWDGQLEDFRIYNSQLSAPDIATLAATSPVDCPSAPFTCDDFESGLTNWTITSNGGISAISGATYNSASNSLYTGGGDVTATLSTVDTSTFGTVEVNAWVRRGDDSFSENPDINEDLVLSYLNSSSVWVVLETFAGGGTVGEIYDQTYTLPASAIHSNFQLRLQQTDGDYSGGNYYDYWHIDDVCVQDNQPTAVAHYAMEEASWGTVTDSIGGYNGSAFNGANTVGTSCRYGQFDGVDDYVQIPHNAALNGSNALTYVAYIRPDSWTGIDQVMAKSVHAGGSGRAQMGIFSESGVFKGRVETAGGRYEVQAPLPAIAGDWIQVALVFDGTSLTLYQDGGVVATNSFSSTTLNQNNDPLNIGKRVGTSQYYFHGLIDDVRVYTVALTAQQVLDLYNTVTPCSLTPTLDHIEISHDGSALTCSAETLTIRACADASCTSVATSDVIVTLSATGGTSSWSSNPVTIPADSSSGVDITLTHRTAETITLSASSLPAASNALV
ncbi:MAG: LamG domain-containing protein, partial [Gammaproteobacteria bacterium]|nr:LamG domain-containing protein [Gammaproteobacteria bacterium]